MHGSGSRRYALFGGETVEGRVRISGGRGGAGGWGKRGRRYFGGDTPVVVKVIYKEGRFRVQLGDDRQRREK